MARFGKISESRLVTCHPDLIKVCRRAIKHYDFHVVCGFRGEDAQELAFELLRSQAHWPESKHNAMKDGKPRSNAVDLVPWINGRCAWEGDLELGRMAGVVLTCADELGVRLRWGPDFMPSHLPDAYHFELKTEGV